ncbi:hypothetical protein CFC21_083422 [Triticum aestivum]|uniref:Uncharacterized protein n=3 Tax=Triticum TaxID=4564 RepID=A0A9R0XZZ8_TRITD|nr:hypothetical protein CFC21_083422 [Triticum aestivum]VAI46202.1 unnamed protein product [Triticum turgidum subsp. durum]
MAAAGSSEPGAAGGSSGERRMRVFSSSPVTVQFLGLVNVSGAMNDVVHIQIQAMLFHLTDLVQNLRLAHCYISILLVGPRQGYVQCVCAIKEFNISLNFWPRDLFHLVKLVPNF